MNAQRVLSFKYGCYEGTISISSRSDTIRLTIKYCESQARHMLITARCEVLTLRDRSHASYADMYRCRHESIRDTGNDKSLSCFEG